MRAEEVLNLAGFDDLEQLRRTESLFPPLDSASVAGEDYWSAE
jgi:hypothetical protein